MRPHDLHHNEHNETIKSINFLFQGYVNNIICQFHWFSTPYTMTILNIAHVGKKISNVFDIGKWKRMNVGRKWATFVAAMKFHICAMVFWSYYFLNFIGSVWTCVVVSIDRFIAVKYPLHSKIWCTPKRAVKVLSSLTVVIIIYQVSPFYLAQNHNVRKMME